MITAPFSDRKTRATAMILVIALCLPLFTVALAASVPSAPQSLTAVAGDGQIALVWFAPENDGGAAIISYQVSIDGGDTWTDTGLITSFTYTGLAGGKLYTFMVRAMNSAGSGDEAIANVKPSGSGDEATPTPAPTGNGTGTGTGAGQGVGRGTGEGQKPGDQQQNPPQPPPYKPPSKVDPPPEENIPIEIDPADVTEKPFKPKKEKVQEAVTVWTITAEGMQSCYSSGSNHLKWDCTLKFKASKIGDTMYGIYNGNGVLSVEMDSAYYHAVLPRNEGELAAEGSLTEIMLILVEEKGEPDAKYKQAMAEYEKALAEYNEYIANRNNVYRGNLNTILRYNSDARGENGEVLWQEVVMPNLKRLMDQWEETNPRPPKPKKPQNPNAYYAKGRGSMNWNSSTTKNHFVEHTERAGDTVSQAPEGWYPVFINEFDVILYADGNGIVTLTSDMWKLTYKARLTKTVEMVDAD